MNRNNPSYPSPVQSGKEGSFILHFAVAGAAFVTCCWPYLIWHGTDRYGRMTWDTSSWTACLLWWLGASLLIYVIAVLVKASRVRHPYAPSKREVRELARLKDRMIQLRLEEMRTRQGLRDDDLRAHALREEQWL